MSLKQAFLSRCNLDLVGLTGYKPARARDTVESFIAQFRKSSIKSEFPAEFLNMTVEEALKSGNTAVRKLLIDSRFVKQ